MIVGPVDVAYVIDEPTGQAFWHTEGRVVPRNAEPNMQNRVRELRRNHGGMTQQSLADQVGVTRQTVIALEGGAYTPSLALALRISRVFGTAVEEVFWLEE